MPRHIHEQQEIGLVALLKQGKPAGSTVTFVLFRDGTELEKIEGKVVTDANARAGKAATAKYTPKDVPADKPSYVLTYKAVADGDEYKTSDEIHVWPKKGKLTALRKDDGKPFPGFKFKVMQNGAQFGPIYKVETDKAVAEFKLDKGSPFALVGAEPYEIKSTEKTGTALRDLKSKGVINFNAEFVTPKRPNDGRIKQWINLDADAAKKGADGNGHEVEIEVGVQGDRDAATGATKDKVTGAPGVLVFINVTFSGPSSKKSKRNSPKTDLVAGLDLIERTVTKDGANDPEWKFKGKVELKSPGGVGKFKVNLGKAGGDTCKIELGSSAALGGPTLTFTNWRKIWYELMAPDFMELEERDLPAGGKARDFAAAGRTNINASGDKTFVKYELYKSHSFTEAECPAGTVMKREFFEYTTGNAKVYLLTDLTFKKYPKNFDKGKGSRATCIKACDINLYSDGPGTDDPIDRAFDATTARCRYDIWSSDLGIYWIPKSGSDGTDTIKRLTWAAKIANPATYKARPAVQFDPDEDTHVEGDGSSRTISVRETLQNRGPVTLTYKKPVLGKVGNVSTDLDASAKAALDGLLGQLYAVPVTRAQIAAIRGQGNKLKFKLTGLLGNARRTQRFQKIKDYLTGKVAATGPEIPTHPGLDDVGDLRSGVLKWADVVDMDRSHHHKFVINLPAAKPTDPGSFVGPLNATHCPVTVTVRFEPHHGGNGLAGQGAQQGEILIRWGINCPLCITDTFLHELGHQYNLAVVAKGTSTGLDDHKWKTADAVHAPGLPIPKTIAQNETNADYRHNGTKGHCYSRRAHSGSHCAWGLSDAQKATPGDTNGICTEYGSGPRDDTKRTRLSFCKQCIDYIRARDLSALK